jgi:hypothetical protein
MGDLPVAVHLPTQDDTQQLHLCESPERDSSPQSLCSSVPLSDKFCILLSVILFYESV